MSAFDTIVCEYPIRCQKTKFQTKDLDCTMANFKISKVGKLQVRQGRDYIDYNFTGDIEFYTYDAEYNRIAFNARFENGNLVWLKELG